jgi:hypothetical protein
MTRAGMSCATPQALERVVIRIAGDYGGGMQLTGDIEVNIAAGRGSVACRRGLHAMGLSQFFTV